MVEKKYAREVNADELFVYATAIKCSHQFVFMWLDLVNAIESTHHASVLLLRMKVRGRF